MIHLFAILHEPVFLTGIAAAACLTSSLLFRARHLILCIQLVGCLCLASHYFYLGVTVAVAANIMGAVQTGMAIFAGRNGSAARLGYALIVLLALTGLWFWQGPISALGVIAQSLMALGRMQNDIFRMRWLLLFGSSAWMHHDFTIDAWIVFAADVGAFTVGAGALAWPWLQRLFANAATAANPARSSPIGAAAPVSSSGLHPGSTFGSRLHYSAY